METANPGQYEAWNGEEGQDWAVNAVRYEATGDRAAQPFVRNRIVAAVRKIAGEQHDVGKRLHFDQAVQRLV